MKYLLAVLVYVVCIVSVPAAIDEASLLRAEQAFKVTLHRLDDKTFQARFVIADGYYLYRDRLKFALKPPGAELAATLPAGIKKHDEYFGEVEIYRSKLDVSLVAATSLPAHTEFQVTSQGCADAGLCYPPQTVVLKPDIATSMANGVISPDAAVSVNAGKGEGIAESTLRGGNPLLIMGIFFVIGLGLAFTACMYPLIPIVSGIVVGQGAATSKRRSLMLSLVYVQGMALAYALAGIAAALSGTLLAAAMQHPLVLGGFGLFFVAMALSMFGVFDLQLPTSIQSRLNDVSNRLPGGRWVPVFAMGALSALIVGPCVTPALAAALGYIGSSGNVMLGGLALYSMALGIGAPLLVVGAAGGHVLPKAGPWMTSVRHVFGAVMLALALWIARPIMPGWLFMLGLAALSIGMAVHLSALDPLPVHAHRWQRVWKTFGTLLLVFGVAQLMGLLAGQRDPLQPLRGIFAAQAQVAGDHPLFTPVRSRAELDNALSAAKGKWVMLDFYADWCVSCKEMERFTFSNVEVQRAMQDMVLLKVDVTGNSAEDQALLNRFRLVGPPGTIFFAPDGRESAIRLVGYEDPAPFVDRLARLKRGG